MLFDKEEFQSPDRDRRPVCAAWLLATLLACVWAAPAEAARCLYVSSSQHGGLWNDRIESAIETTLGGRCLLDRFYMDSDHDLTPAHAEHMAQLAWQHIEATKPDVILACDDNASKYLVQPYLKDGPYPVVFCGINWSVEPYGYPYRNATGIMEVPPLDSLLEEIKGVIRNPLRGLYLSADVMAEHKDYGYYRHACAEGGIELDAAFVATQAEWKRRYQAAQDGAFDFIVLGNTAGIADWDGHDIRQFTPAHSKILSVTNYDWMLPYSMLGLVKLPEEQGIWAAKVALSLLDGYAISRIPIVVNRHWKLYVNPPLFARAGLVIPKSLTHKAGIADYH